MTKNKKIAIIIGIIDGFIIFLIPILIYIFNKDPYSNQTENILFIEWPYIVFILLPFSIITICIGKNDAERTLLNKNSVYKSISNGATLGLIFWVLIHIFGFAKTIHAAGTIYDAIIYNPYSLTNWVNFIISSFLSLVVFSCFGSINGIAFYYFNKFLLRFIKM